VTDATGLSGGDVSIGRGPQPAGVNPPVNLLTIVLEDYFQVAPLKSLVENERWYRFEKHVEDNTLKTLALLDEYGTKATFFVLGWIADQMPKLVQEVIDRGHEVASKGYAHRSINQFDREGFRKDLLRSREAIESATGLKVDGYRIAHGWFGPDDLWALDVLAEEGFRYDSSVRPLFRRYADEPQRCVPHVHRYGEDDIHEFPLPAWSVAGWSMPIAGGNYMRQFPHWWMKRRVAKWMKTHDAPFLFYFHVWELDPDQPRIAAAPLRERIRQYRNLGKMADIIRYYLDNYEFTGIADFLGLPVSDKQEKYAVRNFEAPAAVDLDEGVSISADAEKLPVTIVVPCFNEELLLPYLSNTLLNVESNLGGDYDFTFVFVDDGSGDGTWQALHRVFDHRPNCSFHRHTFNRGVAAAILTGIAASTTEVVCSIDCDCTYDPLQLERMIPLLVDGVDMVTASPYHPDGVVRNVPNWRLFLSKTLSSLYRRVLNHEFSTYTSCFRVYRRSSMADSKVQEGGFLGVAEMLGRLDLRGGQIVECPAVLEVRLLGRSKMKTLRTILGHLRLLTRLYLIRASTCFGFSSRGLGDRNGSQPKLHSSTNKSARSTDSR